MVPAKKTTPAPATTPAPDPDPVQAPSPDPQEPAAPAGGEPAPFCPDPGVCFPNGVDDTATSASCVHGDYDLR